MVNRDFEQVAIFTLKEEEKGTLNDDYTETGLVKLSRNKPSFYA